MQWSISIGSCTNMRYPLQSWLSHQLSSSHTQLSLPIICVKLCQLLRIYLNSYFNWNAVPRLQQAESAIVGCFFFLISMRRLFIPINLTITPLKLNRNINVLIHYSSLCHIFNFSSQSLSQLMSRCFDILRQSCPPGLLTPFL